MFSARTVVDDAIVRRAGLAGIRESAQLPASTGTDRSVFAGAECRLVATAAVAAWAIAHDAVSGPIGKAGIGEGLAVAAAAGADRLILPGAELRLRPWRPRARSRSFVHHHRACRKQCRQEQESKALSREKRRKEFHQCLPAHDPEDHAQNHSAMDPLPRKTRLPILAIPLTNATPVCGRHGAAAGAIRLSARGRWPMRGPALADDRHGAGSIEVLRRRAHRAHPRRCLATITFPCDKFRVRAFATRRAERFGRPFPDNVNL